MYFANGEGAACRAVISDHSDYFQSTKYAVMKPLSWENTSISFNEAKKDLKEIFEKAVRRQMISDVPIGAYLSGGMDSGSIAAIASKEVDRGRTS